jgi:hypothetical protein
MKLKIEVLSQQTTILSITADGTLEALEVFYVSLYRTYASKTECGELTQFSISLEGSTKEFLADWLESIQRKYTFYPTPVRPLNS